MTHLTSSRGTSPVNSVHSGGTLVYEVEDSDDDGEAREGSDSSIIEEPTESAEAELSTWRPCVRISHSLE
jgi:hypothetical protein